MIDLTHKVTRDELHHATGRDQPLVLSVGSATIVPPLGRRYAGVQNA